MSAPIRTADRIPRYGIVREAMVQDTRLSTTARLLAVWLATRPPGWVVHPSHAQRVLGIGRDAYYSARRQLIDAGYAQSQQTRTENGTLAEIELVFDQELGAFGSAGSGQSVSGSAGYGQDTDIPTTKEGIPNINSTTATETVMAVDESLEWPRAIDPSQRAACMQSMAGLSVEEMQVLLDELAGQPTGRVRQPVKWLDGVTRRHREGAFTAKRGVGVQAARAAQMRFQVERQRELDVQSHNKTDEAMARSAAIKEAALEASLILVGRRRIKRGVQEGQ